MRCHVCWSISSAVLRRADMESLAIEDRNEGLRNKSCGLSGKAGRQTHQHEPSSQRRNIGQRPQERESSTAKAAAKRTRHYSPCPRQAAPRPIRKSRTRGCPAFSRQPYPPHSLEETYKRWVSTQYDSIQFCNSCSARDTRPKNLTRAIFNQICSVKPPSFIS